ncbi:glycogen debranching N-terminal domain-containing protein [Rugosimonospora acidiphila]|uniref:Glycogen debranching N-terminal domain-containing protein n=1 Tax=Rugosimonospora acidiphila TaxID=556531 RepID=A0ABP9SQP4_9ACTN
MTTISQVRQLQPLLHDLTATVHAPVSALSGHDGQIRGQGVQGVFYADCRALSEAVLRVDGDEPEPVMHSLEGVHAARFVSLARRLGNDGPDPTVRIDRLREAAADGLTEEIRVSSSADDPVLATVTVELGCDLAPMDVVKHGGTTTPRPARHAGGELVWSTEATSVHVGGEGALVEPAPASLTWTIEVPPGQTVTLRWRVRVVTTAAAVTAAHEPVEWSRPELVADDRRLVRLLRRSLDDLAALRLAEPAARADTFLGGGVPWFLTLFGRDSIWAARMLLPTGTGLAAGTLRTLARRQGERTDPASGEAPGKIMHELRYGGLFAVHADAAPAVYYGTIDATPLWISLLHDAWRWGMPEAEVAALLPNLRAALGWLAEHADPNGDGFIEYLDLSGRGLANQGWKDSGDSVRFRDGRIASGPIALCEVQGYAYQAAVNAAALLTAFGQPGARRWLDYADAMALRFRERFWVDGPDGRYPALALDRDGRPVDSLTSNIGHLLGTGLLNDAESAEVAAALGSPAMSSGFGLRTMSAGDGGFSPLSYHCGSVWPHDTAIAVAGLARAGFGVEAAELVEGVLAAAEGFGYRLPELYGGDDRAKVGRPVPYPAACHPQAWSAAASVAILQAALGLEADVPAGELRVRPIAGAPLGAIRAGGLRVAGRPVEVALDADGRIDVTGLPDSIRVVEPAVAAHPPIPSQPTAGRSTAIGTGSPSHR